MWEDGYESSHPINANVTYPDEIINLFDSITFNKGPAILRMIESLVNPTNMQMALRVSNL
jgi:aminopeptidase N